MAAAPQRRLAALAAHCRAGGTGSDVGLQQNAAAAAEVVPPKHFLHHNQDYTVEQTDDFPELYRSAHETAYRTFADEFEFVGPVTFDYAVVDDDKVDISISGDTTKDPPTFKHMMNISRANAELEPEAMVRSATGRALHENFHMYQQAYAAPSKATVGGDETETWHFNGPRWWTEGTAEWIALVYPQLASNDLKGDAEDLSGVRERIDERCAEYRKKRAASRQDSGEPVTISEVISRNEDENPDWKYVDAQDLYRR